MSAEPNSSKKTDLRRGKTRPEPDNGADTPNEPIDDLVDLSPEEIAPRAKVIDVNEMKKPSE